MNEIVISGTGVFTPKESITNKELVEAYNAYAEKFNTLNKDLIDNGELDALELSNEDFIYNASGIKNRYVMDKKGIFLDDLVIPIKFRKLDRFEVRKLAVKDLKQKNLLIKTEEKIITQPFGDRSGVVIEPMLTNQWFVDTKKIVQPAIDAVKSGETRIYPKQDEKVYFHWLENIEPWSEIEPALCV